MEETSETSAALILHAAMGILEDIKGKHESPGRSSASRWRALSALLQRPDCFTASDIYETVLREIKNTFPTAPPEFQMQQIALLAQTTAPGVAGGYSVEGGMVTPLLLQEALRSVIDSVAATPISAQSTARLSSVALLIGQNEQALRLRRKVGSLHRNLNTWGGG